MKPLPERVSKDGEFVPRLNEAGQEVPDPTPLAPPIGFKREPPLHERIRAMVQHEFVQAGLASTHETLEEAEDFWIPNEDENDPREGRFAVMPGYEWEENYEPPKSFDDMRRRLIDAGWTPPEKSYEAAPAPSAAPTPASSPAPSQQAADPPRGGSGLPPSK